MAVRWHLVAPRGASLYPSKLKRLCSARVIGAGHSFIQNLHRSHYELTTDVDSRHRISEALTELALAI